MSKNEIDVITDQYEEAASRASIDVQIAFAGLRYATRRAAEAGAIPLEEGAPVVVRSEPPSSRVLSRTDLVQQATYVLFKAVRDGGLDGEPVNETNLSLQFGVSRTTVRQALTTLEGIGVVDTSKVPPIFSARDIPKRRARGE